MRLELARTAAAAVRRGHPWVYREGLRRPPSKLDVGAPVVLTEGSDVLASGLWDPGSPIAVRVFAPGETRIDDGSVLSRLEAAIGLRERWFSGDSETTAYRLCNGEGDRVPGLVVDRYGDFAVVRLDGGLLHPWLDRSRDALGKLLARHGIRGAGLRIDADTPGGVRLSPLAGKPPPERVVIRERGMAMEVDLARGQKTGAFLDQRDNRARIRALCRGRKRMLNLFSYAGGFSLAAALGGAEHVTSVDSASGAHASAQRSFRENGLDPAAHAFVTADVFDLLEKARARGDRFDLVVSDPPSFAPSERAKARAASAYKRLHAAAAAVLAPGGVFCPASCSSHVTAEDFLATLDDATLGRSDLRVRGVFGQPDDHPSLPAWPEGRYLKFVVMEG